MSFESVNFPDRYLRHQGFEVVLAQRRNRRVRRRRHLHQGGGTGERELVVVPIGQLPTRYLRHWGVALRVDPVSTATDRADATFHVGY